MESDSHTPGLEVTAAREKGISHLRLGNLFPSQTESPPCQAQGGGGGRCTAFVPSSLSPHPIPLALASSQPAEEPGKQSDNNSGSGSLSPARGVTVSPAVGAQGGCGSWFPVGMGSLGGHRDEPPWCVCCPGGGCPQSVSPRLSPPSLPGSRVSAGAGALGATWGTPSGSGFGSRYVPQSLDSAAQPGCGTGTM